MRRTWPPTIAGSHYPPMQENVQLGEIEAEIEQEERWSYSIVLHVCYRKKMEEKTKTEEGKERFSNTGKDLDCCE